MGHRYMSERYERRWEAMGYTERKIILRLNESWCNQHTMLPYGSEAERVDCRQIFAKKHTRRVGNQCTYRRPKKAARQLAKRQLCAMARDAVSCHEGLYFSEGVS